MIIVVTMQNLWLQHISVWKVEYNSQNTCFHSSEEMAKHLLKCTESSSKCAKSMPVQHISVWKVQNNSLNTCFHSSEDYWKELSVVTMQNLWLCNITPFDK